MAEPHVNATAPEGAEGKAEPGRSIIVKGASLEEAVSQGVFLLNAPRDQVTYEVLQQGSAGRNGRLAVPYRLRVSVGGAVPDPAAGGPAVGAAGSARTEPDPVTAGISPQDLEGLSSPAFLALLERVAERTRAAIAAAGTGDGRAGSDPANAASDAAAALDGEVVVEVAPNHMEAYLTVTPAFGGGREADATDVRGALAAHGVRYGIDEAALAEAIAGKRAARLRVALGLAPQAGAAAAIRYVYPGGACAEAPSNAFEVAPGTVVAVKTGPGEGAPGMSVLGEVLPAHRGQDLSLLRHKGKNLSVSPDGRALVATASGRVSATADGKIHVESTLVLDRDVTPAADGNLHFGGDILIRGSVARGVSVTAGGSVTITGNVDVAVVQAGGDVTIEGGVHGRGIGVLRAKGSVRCRFLEAARVQAGGDVQVEEYVRNGEIRADRRVTVGGSVVGGQIYGVRGVRVRDAGAPQGTPTTLAAGAGLGAREEIERLRERCASVAEREAHLTAVIGEAVAGEQVVGAAPSVDRRLGAVRAVEERVRLAAENEALQARRNALLAEIDAPRPAAVSVTNKAHPRVRVLIDDAALELPTATQYANFTRDVASGAIRVTALT